MAAKKDTKDKDPPVSEADAKADGKDGAPAEGAEGAPAEGAEGAKKGGNKLIIIIGGAVALLVVAGAGLYFTGMLNGLLGKKAAVVCAEGDEKCKAEQAKTGGDKKEGEAGKEGEKPANTSVFLPIPTMIVNISSEDGTPRYLRLTVQLELKDEKDMKAVQAVIPRVIDQFQTYLRELRVKDLRGSAGIYRLQMELLWRVNQAASPVEVKDVLFQEILIQ